MRVHIGLLVLLLAIVGGCGGEDLGGATDAAGGDDVAATPAPADDPTEPPDTTAEEEDPGAAAAGGDCPLDAAALAALTGRQWTQRGPFEDEIPWLDGVTSIACIVTADETTDDGDPVLMVRTDEVRGEDRTTARDDFTADCEDVGGVVRGEGAGAAWCEGNDGAVVTAYVERDDSTVLVNILTGGDEDDARELLPVLEELLELIG